jgi:uncharacterized protein (DUF2236 family)
MKARIVNGVIVEILSPLPGFTIEQCFHPAVLAGCIDHEDGMVVGEPWPRVAPSPVQPE